MAKTSQIAKLERKKALVAKHAAERTRLKAIIRDPRTGPEAREAAYAELRALPRDSSPTRIKHRCQMTGRSRAYLRKFGLSRIAFRELALEGKIPGVRKASW